MAQKICNIKVLPFSDGAKAMTLEIHSLCHGGMPQSEMGLECPALWARLIPEVQKQFGKLAGVKLTGQGQAQHALALNYEESLSEEERAEMARCLASLDVPDAKAWFDASAGDAQDALREARQMAAAELNAQKEVAAMALAARRQKLEQDQLRIQELETQRRLAELLRADG